MVSLMTRSRAIALGVLTALAVATGGCNAGPAPTAPAPSGATAGPGAVPSGAATDVATPSAVPDRSATPDGTDIAIDELGGAWRAGPIPVDDARTAIASDACAAAARQDLGETEANLPTAIVDARGEHLITVIMADDLNAILCLARFDDTAAVATVDSVDRLAASAVVPVDTSAISVAALFQGDDGPDARTVAFGRLGPQAAGARVGFGDRTVDIASTGDGWWAIWWPGTMRPNSIAAVAQGDVVVGKAEPPAGQLEARVTRAAWWLDPTAVAPTATSTIVHALVIESACASGRPGADRVEPPTIDLEDAAVTVTIDIRRRPGGQDCQGNAPFAYSITLPEALGTRSLLDGSETPPREANTVPSG